MLAPPNGLLKHIYTADSIGSIDIGKERIAIFSNGRISKAGNRVSMLLRMLVQLIIFSVAVASTVEAENRRTQNYQLYHDQSNHLVTQNILARAHPEDLNMNSNEELSPQVNLANILPRFNLVGAEDNLEVAPELILESVECVLNALALDGNMFCEKLLLFVSGQKKNSTVNDDGFLSQLEEECVSRAIFNDC